MDDGSLRKLLIFVAVLVLLAGGLSPLVLAPQARAATSLDWTDSRGPGNGDATALAWDDTHKILYRATSGKGVWKYQGGTWTSLGGAVSTYVITSLAYDDIGNKLYAGTNAQGVWCYDPSNGTWANVATIEVTTYYITCLAWGEGKLYAGCWYNPTLQGMGVWCYDPSGSGTWTNTGGGVSTWRIVSLTWGDNKLYAGCIDRSGSETAKGVWCYDPGPGPGPGTWSDTDGLYVSGCFVYSLAWDTNNSLLYAGSPNQGLFRYDPASGDPDKWTDCRLANFGITSLAYDAEHSRLCAGRSDPASVNYFGVWSHDDDDPFTIEGWADTGGGVSACNVTSLVCGAYDQYSQYLFAGTSGQGVWRLNLSDSPSIWSDTGGGVTTYGISSLAYDDAHDLLYAGTNGYGVWCYDPATQSWSDTGGAVSSYGILSLAWGGDKLYAGCRDPSYGTPVGVWCYDPATQSWSDTDGGVSTFEINAFAYDASHNLLYAGTVVQGVWCYDPASGLADKWSDVSGDDMDTFNVTSLAMGGDKLYAGCYDTVPGYEGTWSYDPASPGAGWTNTGGGVSTFRIYSLAWSGDRLYASCRDSTGWGVKGVWCYDPSNPNPDKWSAVSMPGTITLQIFSMAWGGNKLYASCSNWGTEVREGVWCYDPSGDSWSDTGGGVSTLNVSSFTYDAGHSRLYAGTGSQGVWYAEANNPAPTVTSVSPDHKTAGDGGFTLTVTGTGFINGSSVRWNGSNRTTTYVSSTKLTASIPASDIKTARTAKVTVFNPAPGGGTSNAETFTINAKPKPPPPEPPVNPASPWYLAEGSTDYGFDCYITIENPNASDVTAQVTYMTGSGAVTAPDVSLSAKSQATVNPREVLGNQDFSTKVVCKEGKAIAVDRTMSWTGEGASSPEAHSSIGVNSPAKTWYLPEGSTNWGFETWLLIQNPNSGKASCKVTYMIEGEAPQEFVKEVPANARASFSMEKDIGNKDASIKVEGNIPVIPERAMYRNNRREGHDSIGTTSPASDFYLAEGTSAYGFTTYVLIQNPNSDAADVTVTYMTPTGPKPQAPFSMDPNSRKTIRVNDVLPGTDFSTKVHGTKPIIAERAMYWDNGTGEACHDSVGMASAHTSFYLPDGQTSEGRETYTLVQNPNSSPVTVQITYMTPTGAGNKTFTDTIGANSRMTYNMADKGIGGRAAIMVTSKTSGKKIMCERAMYWNARGAGTDTIGGYSD